MTDVYLPGETVTITLANARVLEHTRGAGLTVEVGGHRLTVPLGPGTTVDRYRPADGWPEPGEIWSDADGLLWAAVGDREHAGVWLINVHSGEQMGVSEVNAMRGPLRRTWRPTGETTNGSGGGSGA